MKKNVSILGSTGSIGLDAFKILSRKKNSFKVNILAANKNYNLICDQIIKFKPKIFIIDNQETYIRVKKRFKKKNIIIINKFENQKNHFQKSDITIAAIPGIAGLKPTIELIKKSKKVLIANKESIICGWQFINKALNKNKTNFIPIDSEHFSIWTLLKDQNLNNIKRIYLTASGGPFLYKKKSEIINIKPYYALKHPNWKMGKKISIDSATLMNKIFEVIEAKKIFNLDIKKFKIIIHPKSYVHAIVHFNNGLVKFLAHDTNMAVPIMNSLYMNGKSFKYKEGNVKFELLNGLNFINPNVKKFPVVKLLNLIKNKPSYFETILISINDFLVDKYLKGDINYFSINTYLIKLIKTPYFTRYYKSEPKNIIDIQIMVRRVINYLNKIKFNEN